MMSLSHWGMHKVDVAGTDNFREQLVDVPRKYGISQFTAGNAVNFLTGQNYTAQQYQAAAHKWD